MQGRFATLFVAVLATLALPAAQAADWGQERGGPGHTGRAGWDTGGTGLPVWRVHAFADFNGGVDQEYDAEGYGIASDIAWPPALADGRLIVLVSWMQPRGGFETSVLHAFDAATGAVLWAVPLDAEPGQAPLVSGDEVLVVTADGRLLAFAAQTGEGHGSTPGIVAPVSVRDRTVYFGRDDAVVAMARNGTVHWSVTWPGERPLLAGADRHLGAGGLVLAGAGPAVLADQVVVATSTSGDGFDGLLHRLDRATGADLVEPQWVSNIHMGASAREDGLAAAGGELFGSPGSVCLDAACTQHCGHGPDDRATSLHPLYGPLALDDTALLGWDSRAVLLRLDDVPTKCAAMADDGSGHLGELGVGIDAEAHYAPALGQAAAYVPGSFKGLHALRPDGSLAWDHGWLFVAASAVVVGEGLLHGVDGDGWLYALDIGAGGEEPGRFDPTDPVACFCQLALEKRRSAHELIVWINNEGWTEGTVEVALEVNGRQVDAEALPLKSLGHGNVLFTLDVDRDDRVEACIQGGCVPAVWDEDDDGVDEDDAVAGADDGVLEAPMPGLGVLLILVAAAGTLRRRRSE